MTTWSNADILVEMLDRELRFLIEQGAERRIFLLRRFLRFLHREPQLIGLVIDQVEEVRSLMREFSEADHKIREQLAALWQASEPLLRSILAEDLSDEQVHALWNMDGFTVEVARRPQYKLPKTILSDDASYHTESLASALHHWGTWATQKVAAMEASPPALLVQTRIQSEVAKLQLRHLKRNLRMNIDTLPGVAYLRLKDLVREANPRPPTSDQDLGLRLATFERVGEFANHLHAEDASEYAEELDIAAECVAEDARLVAHDLQLKLLSGRSRLALVARYAARCESFDAKAIRERVADDSSNAERQLTLDFAKYLFDQGLTPILEPTLSGLRPDVVNLSANGLLYVEAKQYGDSISRSKIVSAYHQVWSTWGRLRNTHVVPEAFLLVFRVGGPRAELPSVIQHDGKRLYSVLVDVSAKAGSRETETPLSFKASELCPVEEDLEGSGVTPPTSPPRPSSPD